MIALGLLSGLLLAPGREPGVSPETAQAVLERAVAAHGGRARLARVRADRVKMRGAANAGSQTLPLENEILVSLPGKFKSVMRLTVAPGKVQTVVHTIDGDAASLTVDGQPMPLSAAQLAQLRQTLQTNQAVRLVPLLDDPSYGLTLLADQVINGRPAVGVRVTGFGQREVRLYFDRASALLVKTEHQLEGPTGREGKQEIFYSQFRDLGGYLRPGKVVALRDGRKVLEAELVEAVPLERIDPAEFTVSPR